MEAKIESLEKRKAGNSIIWVYREETKNRWVCNIEQTPSSCDLGQDSQLSLASISLSVKWRQY